MKRKIIWICIALQVLLSMFFLYNCVYVGNYTYANNFSLSSKENRTIKSLVLSAVKDRCLITHNMDASAIYYGEDKLLNIQFYEKAEIKKKLFCIVDPFFMHSVEKTDDNRYNVILKIYYPENCYYHFTIELIENVYVITQFQIDT